MVLGGKVVLGSKVVLRSLREHPVALPWTTTIFQFSISINILPRTSFQLSLKKRKRICSYSNKEKE